MHTNTDTVQPFVSVIVPVYNDPQHITTCIEALLKQTYPRECYEILVVDNGSTDSTRTVIAKHPVTLLVEDQIQSSYAARNKGIGHVRGEIIAFTDSDCTPGPDWIEEGVRALNTEGVDLVGGNVRFVYSKHPSGAEVYDSISNLQMERGIRDRNVAKTANLFVRATVFQAVGLFPETLQSGGDVYWTRRATTEGFKLAYAPRAEVSHPTRRLRQLLKKQYRVGRGHRGLRAQERRELEQHGVNAHHSKFQKALYRSLWRVRRIPSALLPPSISLMRESVNLYQIKITKVQFYRAWLAGWLARAFTVLGRLSIIRVRH